MNTTASSTAPTAPADTLQSLSALLTRDYAVSPERLTPETLLQDQLKFAIDFAVRNDVLGALAFLDLDNFKHINDNFGHDAGDVVLREIANRLRSSVRENTNVSFP